MPDCADGTKHSPAADTAFARGKRAAHLRAPGTPGRVPAGGRGRRAARNWPRRSLRQPQVLV